MQVLSANPHVPVYTLEPDETTGNRHFRMYNYEGSFPNRSELLVPHRKNHYLLIFVRRGSGRQWIDMTPYDLKSNTFYFLDPSQIIVKEEFQKLWSTGIAFTREFLSLHHNASLSKLPIIQNSRNVHELALTDADALFIDDIMQKIRIEYQQPGEWQQRMLTAYLNVLLTYLSRLYTERFETDDTLADKVLTKQYQEKIDERFRQLHEVADYASILNISPGHLSDVVKIQSGKPAIKHIHDRLILESRRLLLHTDHPLKEIAFSLGFSDASYFNRFFKRETGETPARYRINIRKMYH